MTQKTETPSLPLALIFATAAGVAMFADASGFFNMHREEIRIVAKDPYPAPDTFHNWISLRTEKGDRFKLLGSNYGHANASDGSLSFDDGKTFWGDLKVNEPNCVLAGYSYINAALRTVRSNADLPKYQLVALLPKSMCPSNG